MAAKPEEAQPDDSAADDTTSHAPAGIVIPPSTVRKIIETTAAFVARNGDTFEQVVMAKNPGSNKTAFIKPDDPYHPYYKWRLEEVKAGRTDEAIGRKATKTDVTFQGREAKKAPEKPEEFMFSARMPTINAQDLDIVKLTALYAAKNGRSWVTSLSQREAGSPSFDFLRSQHSLNMFFNYLVDQYKALLEGDTIEKGQPQKKRILELEHNMNDRLHVLERAKQRAQYVKYQEAQKVENLEKVEKDRLAFAQIDWHDFVLTEKVVFDERDETTELRHPMTLNDLQSQSLEQKAAMRIGSDKRIHEAVPTFDDPVSYYGGQPQMPPNQMPPAQMPPPPQQMPPPPRPYMPQMPPLVYPAITQSFNTSADRLVYRPPPQSLPHHPIPNEEMSRAAFLQAEANRIRAAQEAAKAHNPSSRIRNDYVPQAQRRNQIKPTQMCSICGKQIPTDEIGEHMRIEMLDPRWREQQRLNERNSATTNLSTVNVANNLKRMQAQRTDVFDPTGTSLSEEEQNRRKRVELQSYDGRSPIANTTMVNPMGLPMPPPPGMASGNDRPDVQEQIRYLHDKYKR